MLLKLAKELSSVLLASVLVVSLLLFLSVLEVRCFMLNPSEYPLLIG